MLVAKGPRIFVGYKLDNMKRNVESDVHFPLWKERGVAMIEAALGTGLFLFLLLIVLDMFWVLYVAVTSQFVVNELARVASVGVYVNQGDDKVTVKELKDLGPKITEELSKFGLGHYFQSSIKLNGCSSTVRATNPVCPDEQASTKIISGQFYFVELKIEKSVALLGLFNPAFTVDSLARIEYR